MTIRWRNNPRLTGLQAIGAAPQGSTLRDGEEEVANTGNLSGGWHGEKQGWWYWVTPRNEDLGIGYMNTCRDPVPTQKEAKSQARAYIDSCYKHRTI